MFKINNKITAEECYELLEDIGITVEHVDSNRRYWFIRTQGGEYYDEFLREGFVGIGDEDVPCVAEKDRSDALLEKVKKFHPQATRTLNQVYRFCKEIHKDDIVIIPSASSAKFAFGIIEDDDIYNAPDLAEVCTHFLKTMANEYPDYNTLDLAEVCDHSLKAIANKYPDYNTLDLVEVCTRFLKTTANEYPDYNTLDLAEVCTHFLKAMANEYPDYNMLDLAKVCAALKTDVVAKVYSLTEACPYSRRRKIQWIQDIPKSRVDSKLYTFFHNQQKLSNVDDYGEFIERALNPFYEKDGKAHFTLSIMTPESPNAFDMPLYMGGVLTRAKTLYKELNYDDTQIDVQSRTNVQSTGLIELLGDPVFLALVGFVIVGLFGGKAAFHHSPTKGTSGEVKTDGLAGFILSIIDRFQNHNTIGDDSLRKAQTRLHVKNPVQHDDAKYNKKE